MNCQEFTPIMFDLARGRLPDIKARRDGLAHTENCATCGARLAQEKSLTFGLKAFADAAKAEQTTPQRVEANLLSALRASQQQPAPVAIHMFGFRRVWGRLALVAATALVAAVPLWRNQSDSVGSVAADTAKVNSSFFNSQVNVPGESQKPRVYQEIPTPPALIRAKPVSARYAPKSRAKPRAATEDSFTAHSREIYTEYFPINDTGSTAPSEEFQVVRVSLPRSAMASFGLPVHPAQANERINADVIIGADGIARAVRFVR